MENNKNNKNINSSNSLVFGQRPQTKIWAQHLARLEPTKSWLRGGHSTAVIKLLPLITKHVDFSTYLKY